MATEIGELALDEALTVQVDFIAAIRGISSIQVTALDVRDYGVLIRWVVAPDVFTALVPWTNIKSLSQVGA